MSICGVLCGISRAATAIAILAALAIAIVGVARGTWAVGGSDSACYALMADAFARGALQPSLPLAEQAPWPNASLTFAPAGFIPSPVRPAAASPICAPGFSLVMVPFRWVGGLDGFFAVTPVAAALLVWCAFVVARRLAGPIAGALAAVATGTSPIVLFQSVQPMNDVMTAALWTGVLAAATITGPRRDWWMGVLAGFAVLIRPNLVPLAAVVAVWVCGRPKGRPLQAIGRVLLAAAPFILLAGVLNWSLYGHPFRLGYGAASDLFSARFIATNAAQYGRALLDTQLGFPMLALATPFIVQREHRALVWLGLGIAAMNVVIYLFYRPFDEWWYLRFLLPAIVIGVALASAAIAAMVRRPAIVAAVAVALGAFGLKTSFERQAFDLQRLESRFRHTGHFVRDRLPENAALITVWESGTVRFFAGRETVLWDSIDPLSLEPALAWLRQRGFEPFLLLERWEEPAFRTRFGHSSLVGLLDWPPRYEIDRQVRIYLPGDRDRYLSGHPITTEHIFR